MGAGELEELFLEKKTGVEKFIKEIRSLPSVGDTEVVTRGDTRYLKIYPNEPVISPDLMKVLGEANVAATPDEDGLLVSMGGSDPEKEIWLEMDRGEFEEFLEGSSRMLDASANELLEMARKGVETGRYETVDEGLDEIQSTVDVLEFVVESRKRMVE